MWPFRKRPASSVLPFMFRAAPVSDWDRALNTFARRREVWGVHLNALADYERDMPRGKVDDPEHAILEALSGSWCSHDAEALRDLIDVPAPTIADALLKLELCLQNGENAEPALADLRRLTGIARPALDILEEL